MEQTWSKLQQQLFSLDGHIALATGAGSGLGKYMAHAVLHAGAKVILVGRHLERLQVSAMELFESLTKDIKIGHDSYAEEFSQEKWDALYPELSKRIACIDWDVSKLETIPELVEKANAIFGTPDILINAAGLNPRKPWEEVTPEIYEYTLRLNLSAPFFLAKALVPGMQKKGWGHIINFASLQTFRAFPNGLPYGASKGGVGQLTRAMAQAWSVPGSGITANAVAPGFFKTQLTAPLYSKPEVIHALEKQTTMRRLGTCDDVQGLAIFLASHASDYITGQVISIDGGWTAI